MAKQTAGKQLYDILTTRDFDNFEALDSTTKKPPVDEMGNEDVSKADLFKFDWSPESGKNYGTVVILLTADDEVIVNFGDNLGKTMEAEDKKQWYDFLYQLRLFATRNFKTFDSQNITKLKYNLKGQAAISEGLFESWSGNKTTSWNGKPTEARLMIRHKKQIGEGDARYRYIENLFIETAEGERYKLGFTKLAGGRAMLEHVRNGGKPYDLRGLHITGIVEELNILSRFRRANHGKIFEGDTEQLVSSTNQYHNNLNKVLKGLSSNRGYTNYFESWNPSEVTEQELVIESIKHLFITQNLDSRIEQALPLLAKIQKQQQEESMKEANIFEAWINNLSEGTWALPETPEQQDRLISLLSQELPVGADATNATEQLYDLFGDDQLFDELQSLAERDANADARELIINRLSEFADREEVDAVLSQLDNPTKGELDGTEDPGAAEDSEMDECYGMGSGASSTTGNPPLEEIVDENSMADFFTKAAKEKFPTATIRKDGETLQEPPKREVPQATQQPVDADALKQELADLETKYSQLGGDSWQYADRMMDRDREAQQVGQRISSLKQRIATGNRVSENNQSREGDALLARIKSLALLK